MREAKSKITDLEKMLPEREKLRSQGKTLVFTNGCFDILHAGHVDYLAFARRQGDTLIVAINSDSSVKKNKGENRPVNAQDDRAIVLASLECVDYVLIFNEDEPISVISKILPDILVKGEDWAHYVSGRDIVEANGGRVVLAKFVKGHSTSGLIEKIQDRPSK